MTQHNHTTLVKGCYRCELGRDEEFSSMAEDYWGFEVEPSMLKLGVDHAYLDRAKVKFVSPPWTPEVVAEIQEWWDKSLGETL